MAKRFLPKRSSPAIRAKLPDPALARYPDALAELLSLGEPLQDTGYASWAERLAWHAPDLIEMVLDEDLNWRQEDDPAVWAPIHALRILALLGSAEAAEPLLACLDWDSDWGEDVIPVYGRIGPAAIPLLKDYLDDPGHSIFARGHASHALAAIAQAHPSAHAEVVGLLTAFIDRPAADSKADEETLTAFVIGDLGDLKADSAYAVIRRAFAENRVDPQVIGLEDVERDFGLQPPLDFSTLPDLPAEPGVRLTLKCKACGRERSHLFPKVYCDLATLRDQKLSAKYNPIIIPQRVVCPKCGAKDQYELGAMGQMALTMSLLALKDPAVGHPLPENRRIQFITFTTRWGPMHPTAALARYRLELAGRPSDISLRIGYGNTLKALGYLVEAEAEYRTAIEMAPDNVEPWIGLAQVTGGLGNAAEATRQWQRVAELATHTPMPAEDRKSLLQASQESLEDLRQGRVPEFSQLDSAIVPGTRPARPDGAKVGRNDPCPCGSGKKYKHCHGRKGA